MLDNQDAISPEELIRMIEKQQKTFCSIPKSKIPEYSILLQNLKSNTDYKTTKEKGDALEDIVFFIIDNIQLFNKTYRNIRTSSNEIDLICEFNDCITSTLFPHGLSQIGHSQHLICECKNYRSKIGTTWVGKFSSLIDTHGSSRIGIIFSDKGFTGRSNWSDAKALVRKIYYKHESNDKKKYILDFNLNDFEQLVSNPNFVDIICEKIDAIKLDCDFSSLISKHPAESVINDEA